MSLRFTILAYYSVKTRETGWLCLDLLEQSKILDNSMNRGEMVRQAVKQLNQCLQQPNKQQYSKSYVKVHPQHCKHQIENFAEYINRCLTTLDVKDYAKQNSLCTVAKEFSQFSQKLAKNSDLLLQQNQLLQNYLKKLRACVALVIQTYSQKHVDARANRFIQKAKLQNVKLQKSIRNLTRDYTSPQQKILLNKFIQTDEPFQRDNDPRQAIISGIQTPMRTMRQQASKKEDDIMCMNRSELEGILMEREDIAMRCVMSEERVGGLQKEIVKINIQGKVIAFRKQLKSNPIEFFLPKLQIKGADTFTSKLQSEIDTDPNSKQRNVSAFLDMCSKYDAENLLRNVALEEHPFRVIRTIRAIMDGLMCDLPYMREAGFFEFGLYVENWFRCFEIPYAIHRRTTDIEIDKIKFISALQDYSLSKLWDVLLFREMLNNQYDFDEIDFIVRMRYILIKQPQISYSTGSQIVTMITFQCCKESINTAFKKYPTNITKTVIQKLSKTQIKIKNQYKVDVAYALRLLVDLYRELKSQRMTSFEAAGKAIYCLSSMETAINTSLQNMKQTNIHRIYFEISSKSITRTDLIWKHCIDRGYFNNKIVSLTEQFPKMVNNESFKECLRQYDKLTPLISSFRRSLWSRGSTNFTIRDQELELNNKLWASEVNNILDYFTKLQDLIRDNIMVHTLQTIHTHQRDTQLECSLLYGLLRSISSKLTIWKKINVKTSIYNDYVVSNSKKIQRMIRKHLPYVQHHKEIRETLDNQPSQQ